MIAPSRHKNGMPMDQVMAMIECFRIAHERYDKPKRQKKRQKKQPAPVPSGRDPGGEG